MKEWIAHILNIRRTYFVTYEKCGEKYLRIVTVKNGKSVEYIFRVEHLLNSNFAVTEETLQTENKLFVKL